MKLAIPALPFLLKFLLLKLIKGAVVGLVRFIRRVIHKSKEDDEGIELNGRDRLKHAIDKEWRKRDNIVYLILMLSNAIYGAQELTVWVWRFIAKRMFNEYCAAVPAGFEMPDQFCDRLHTLPKSKLLVECTKWVGMAALLYWPKTHEVILLSPSEDEKWVEVRWKRLAYLVRTDKQRTVDYRDMKIKSDGNGSIEIKTLCGQHCIYSYKVE